MSKKVVLITGCSSGIGRSLANKFHENGYFVYQTSRKLKDIEDLSKKNENSKSLQLDVTKPEEIESCVEEIMKNHKSIDVLVNNAGYSHFSPLLEMSVCDLKKLYDVNIHGVLRLVQAVAPHMIQHRNGLILNISSISATFPSIFAGPYCSSKAACSMLTEILRLELRLFGIHVVDVQPGAVTSKFAKTAKKFVDTEKYKFFRKYSENVNIRMVQGQLSAMSSDEFSEKLVSIVESGEIPDLIRIGPKTFIYPFLRKFLPSYLFDRLVYKVMKVKNVKMERLITFKGLVAIVLWFVAFLLILKLLFF